MQAGQLPGLDWKIRGCRRGISGSSPLFIFSKAKIWTYFDCFVEENITAKNKYFDF